MVADMEDLPSLVARRLRELSAGPEPLSLHEVWMRRSQQDPSTPTYETFRRITASGHSRLTDRTVTALSAMLCVTTDEVYRAARIAPPLGDFTLPERASRLNDRERAHVLSLIDLLLDRRAEDAQQTVTSSQPPADDEVKALLGTLVAIEEMWDAPDESRRILRKALARHGRR